MDSKKNEGEEGTKLADLDSQGVALSNEETGKGKKKEYVDHKGEFLITLILYICITTVALTTDKIIGFASFSGATVSNFICVLSPAIFYLYFSRKKPFNITKVFAIYMLLLGSFLILGYFGFNLYKIFHLNV